MCTCSYTIWCFRPCRFDPGVSDPIFRTEASPGFQEEISVVTKRPHRFSAAPLAILAASTLALAACSEEQAATSSQTETQTPASISSAESDVIEVGDTVANFTLGDQNGVEHELYAINDADAVVLIMQGNGCPIVQKMLPTIKDLAADYGAKNVAFLMINSNFQDNPENMKAEDEKFDINLPMLKDADQSLGKRLGAVRTAETYVIDQTDWTLLYHGPIDDRLTYGREKAVADHDYLADVLDAVLEGRELPHPEKQPADGCLINYV